MSEMYDVEDPGPGMWLQVVGISAIVAAALATVLFTTPTMPEPPSTDSTCQLDLVRQQWTGSSCEDVEAESAGLTTR
ncbi:hypothetical protein L2K70_03275 [Nocardioides KLBMP 9356]|uniref:Uncharacterized protein n=1 Tax=Nocardioides potassii TaxID=2911371 RepID=A0ABS9H9A5_9ACTN|nr:hypothetical protein [Nocardioides potassii]MCF6376613.1 hypothetical protein [Nocardioides potassii]